MEVKHFDKAEIERLSLNQVKEMLAAGEISSDHAEEIMAYITDQRKTVIDKPF